MATEYIMRAQITPAPDDSDGYVFWSVINAPDYTGDYSGYDPSTLSDIVIDYEVPTRVNGSSGPVVGYAGGDLSGRYPNPVVSGLQTRPVSPNTPADKQVLTWSAQNNAWVPAPITFGGIPPAPYTVLGTNNLNQLSAIASFASLGTGLLFQVLSPNTVGFSQLNLSSLAFIGVLPVHFGGNTIKAFAIDALSGVATTDEMTYTTIGGFSIDISNFSPATTGYTRTIKLHALMSTTGPVAQIVLYNLSTASIVPLTNTSVYLSTTSTVPVLVISQDLTTLLPSSGSNNYEVRMLQTTAGTPADQVVCSSCKIILEWT